MAKLHFFLHFIHLDPDGDQLTQMNQDPDPHHWLIITCIVGEDIGDDGGGLLLRQPLHQAAETARRHQTGGILVATVILRIVWQNFVRDIFVM